MLYSIEHSLFRTWVWKEGGLVWGRQQGGGSEGSQECDRTHADSKRYGSSLTSRFTALAYTSRLRYFLVENIHENFQLEENFG